MRVGSDGLLSHIMEGESKDIVLYKKAIGNRFEDKYLCISVRRIAISLTEEFIIESKFNLILTIFLDEMSTHL